MTRSNLSSAFFVCGLIGLVGCASPNSNTRSQLSTVSVARVGGVAPSDYFCQTQKQVRIEGGSDSLDFVFCAENPELTRGASKNGFLILPWGYSVVGKPTPKKLFVSDTLFTDAYKVVSRNKLVIRRYESLGNENFPVYEFELTCTGQKCSQRKTECAEKATLPPSRALVQLKSKAYNDDFLMQEVGKRAILGDNRAREFFLNNRKPRLEISASDEYDQAKTKLEHLKKIGCL